MIGFYLLTALVAITLDFFLLTLGCRPPTVNTRVQARTPEHGPLAARSPLLLLCERTECDEAAKGPPD